MECISEHSEYTTKYLMLSVYFHMFEYILKGKVCQRNVCFNKRKQYIPIFGVYLCSFLRTQIECDYRVNF